jgi:hypothetical protein
MTIRSSASTQRWTNWERLDKEQDSRNNDSCRAECRFRRTLVVVHLALLFRNLACGRTKFRGRSGDCALHEQIVIPFRPAKCYQKNNGLVSTSSRCIENTEPVLSSSRLSPDRRLFVVQLSQHTNTTFNPDDPG